MQTKLELMLDSGAYSAFTQGKPVDLKQYTDFVLANPEPIAHVVNLDVINPGKPEEAAAAGWENFLYMQLKGIDAIPVYHAREHLSWFDKMLDACKYIGISGTSLVSPTEHLAFYDLAWHYGTSSAGLPLAHYHAFGDTAPYSLLTYPWYSADSATWMIQAGRAGSIKLQGKSFRLRSKKVVDNNFISLDVAGVQKESWEYECRFVGLNPEKVLSLAIAKGQASQLAMIRSYFVAADILNLRERCECVDRFKKPKTLISQKKDCYTQSPSGAPIQKFWPHLRSEPVNMYFVISPSAYYFNFPVIRALGIKNILVSYFYVTREKPAFWHEKLVPFLYDPEGFCERDEKTKKFWDRLQEVLLKPIPKSSVAPVTIEKQEPREVLHG